MSLEFKGAPDWLLQEYVNRKSPWEVASEGLQSGLNTYVQAKAAQRQQQADALSSYIKAFEAGGPKFAQDIATRTGLKNPPVLPGSQPAQTPAAPISPTGGSAQALTEQAAQQSLPPVNQSPLIDHWNSLQTPAQTPAQQSVPPMADQNNNPPGLDNAEELVNQGNFGKNRLLAGEALGKYRDAMQTADEKRAENAPKSFDYARAFAKSAGSDGAADSFIAIAKAEGRNSLNRREMDDIKNAINASAQRGRGQYFSTQAELNQQKFENDLLNQANKYLNPTAATGVLRQQQERLNRIGRASALIDQMNKQAGGGDTRQIRELATSLATVLTGGNVVAQQQIEELVPQTYKGNALKFFEKLSNNPTGLEQQDFVKRLAETLDREKETINSQITASQNRSLNAMQVLKQRNPKAYKQMIDANMNRQPEQNTGPHGASVTQNGHTYIWNPQTEQYE